MTSQTRIVTSNHSMICSGLRQLELEDRWGERMTFDKGELAAPCVCRAAPSRRYPVPTLSVYVFANPPHTEPPQTRAALRHCTGGVQSYTGE